MAGSGVQYEGTFTVPSFLDATNQIEHDANGLPIVQGTTQAVWLAIVPTSATGQATPRPLWVYGHGLFSDDTEVARDFGWDTTALAGAVAVATDYTGLTLEAEADAAAAFLDLSTFPPIIDQLRQGIVNTLLLPSVFANECAALPALSALPPLSATDRGYFGNSMGGTLGQTIAALSPDVHRYAVGAAGMDFAVMMPRTHEWPELQSVFEIAYPPRIDRDLLLLMSQTVWDRAESSTFGPHVLTDPLPGSTVATVLMHEGLSDCDTTNIASAIAQRTDGLPAFELTEPDAYVLYSLGVAPLPAGTLPPPVENGVHECVRRDPRAQQQIAWFLPANGQIADTCGGACEPIATTAGCLTTYAGP
jgi:hypothetical protein